MGRQDIQGNTFFIAGRENELLAIEHQLANDVKIEPNDLLINWSCGDL
jgi:hypothetical protein